MIPPYIQDKMKTIRHVRQVCERCRVFQIDVRVLFSIGVAVPRARIREELPVRGVYDAVLSGRDFNEGRVTQCNLQRNNVAGQVTENVARASSILARCNTTKWIASWSCDESRFKCPLLFAPSRISCYVSHGHCNLSRERNNASEVKLHRVTGPSTARPRSV